MKRINCLLVFPVLLVLSCGSGAQPVEQPPAGPAPAVVAEQPAPPQPAVFDPARVSEEMFEATKLEVQALIEDLNGIIRARNYDAWTEHLSASYFETISSQAFLGERAEELYRRDLAVAASLGREARLVQRRAMRTPRDYFDHVVVPARQNDRVDDISFTSNDEVVAHTVDSRGNRLILYNLERIDGKWKISD